MASIKINGTTYSGNNIQVVQNGVVIIDGRTIKIDEKIINITVEGNINMLDASISNSIHVTGSVSSIKTSSGDVEVHGNVSGGVSTVSGGVTCYDVGLNVETTSGDVSAKDVKGNISTTSGDVSCVTAHGGIKM
jgi:hypothetical protein